MSDCEDCACLTCLLCCCDNDDDEAQPAGPYSQPGAPVQPGQPGYYPPGAPPATVPMYPPGPAVPGQHPPPPGGYAPGAYPPGAPGTGPPGAYPPGAPSTGPPGAYPPGTGPPGAYSPGAAITDPPAGQYPPSEPPVPQPPPDAAARPGYPPPESGPPKPAVPIEDLPGGLSPSDRADRGQGWQRAQKSFREAVGLDPDQEVDAYSLQKVLHQSFKPDFPSEQFSIETCRSMVAMCDEDLTGKLSGDEFKQLWDDLQTWKRAFSFIDDKRQGFFPCQLFTDVFQRLEIKLSDATTRAIMKRFGDREGRVHFHDFISCMIRLSSMLEVFKHKDPKGTGVATFNTEEYVNVTMYS